MDADTRELLSGSIRALYASGGDVVAGLEELGWSEVVADDPVAAIELLFTEQGAAARSSSALDTVVFVEHGGVRHPVVHPVAGETSAHIVDDMIWVDGVLLADADRPVIVATGDGTYLVDLGHLSSAVTAVAGFDPRSGLRRVRLRVGRNEVARVDVDWGALMAAARRALSSELVGNGSAMLRIAVDQITDRTQFGRPIGANQSPRHRLSESHVLVRGAAELAANAWRTGSARDALIAKAYAGHALDTASRACLQVCGAIGLTTEHPLPDYVKRARILDALYGGWAEATEVLGSNLITAGSVPTGSRL